MDGTHVADLVTANAARVPDQPAVIDVTSANTLTWAQLDEAVSAEADRVSAAGTAPGDRVVVRLGNGAAFCVAVLGALRAGAVVVPHGPIAVAPELDVVFADCRPTLVVAAEGDDTARACAATVGATVVAPPDLAARAPGRPGLGAGEDIALLVYASGTTGVPRGIRLSHRALLANRAQTAALRPAPVTPVDRVLLSFPLFHSFGLAAGFLQVCWVGATVVLAERLEAEQVADILVTQRVSALAGVPSMFRALLELPAERLRTATAGVRLCTSGGAPLPSEWLAAFQQATGLAIVEGYGLTEAGPIVTTNPLGAPPKPGSVGRALPGVELRLVTADGRPIEPDDDEEETTAPASSPSAGPTSSPATGPTARAAPTPKAGSAPPTSGSSTPTATCTSSSGPPTSSSSTGSTSTPARWSRCSSRSRASPRPRWSGSATSGRARSSRRCWSPTRRRASTRRRCGSSARSGWPGSRCPP